jgi:hypothetical protein
VGQRAGAQARYVARGKGYAISLSNGNAAIGIQAKPGGSSSAISMQFAGGRHVAGIPGPELPGTVNYIRGKDPSQWQVGLPTYGRVTYKGIYSGVDVAYYGNQRQLEFDLILKPGANAGRVRLKFGGARRMSEAADGSLVIEGAGGDLRIPLPAIYQEVDGNRRKVQGRYVLLGGNEAPSA